MYKLPNKSRTKGCLIYLFFSIFFCIGMWGYVEQNVPFSDALYNSIKLIVLNGEEHVHNWQLEFARFALPLFTIMAILKLLWQAIGEQYAYLTLKIFPVDTVIFGNSLPAVVISILAPHLGKRLFLDIHPNSINYRDELPNKGYKLWHFPDLSFNQLRNLSLQSAKNIYLVATQEDINIALAKSIIPLLKDKSHKPRLFISVCNQLMLKMATQEEIFKNYRAQKGEITWINSMHQLARTVLQQRPPLRESPLLHTDVLHIGLIGFSNLIQQLILTIMRNCAYLNIRKIEISLFSSSAEEYKVFFQENSILCAENRKLNIFNQQDFPISVQHYPCHPTNISPKLLSDVIAEKGEFAHIYIHDDSAYTTLELSHKTRQILTALNMRNHITSCLCWRDLKCIEELNQEADQTRTAEQDIHYFSMITNNMHCSDEHIYDILPLIIHTAYLAMKDTTLPPINSVEFAPHFASAFLACIPLAKQHWQEELQEGFRHSNRCAADHLFIKLRELGFELIYSPNNPNKNTLLIAELHCAIQQHLDALLKLEHQRFCQERLTDGWIYANKTDEKLQLHSSLLPFEQLSAQDRHKNESLLRLIPFILAQPMVQNYYQLIKVATHSECGQSTH